MFYHIYHRTVPFRSFPSRLVLSPSSPVPPSLTYAPPILSDPVLSHLVLLFSVLSSCSIEIPSHPVPFLFVPCRLIQFCHVLIRLVPRHPGRVPFRPFLFHLVPSYYIQSRRFPLFPVLSLPVPSHPASFRAGLSCANPFTPPLSPLYH